MLGLFRSGLIHTEPWKQAVAWLVGSALWIAYTFIMWLARGRVTEPQPVAEIPGDISLRPLTRPLILFAVIRAAALAIAVAISFGLQLPSAYWMPIATIIAMKPSLQQSALVAERRIVNYAWYTAALAGAVLIAADVPHPSDLADEGRRILFTFAGVGIAVIVMFLADRLQKHAAKAAPQAPAHPAPAG